MLTKLMKRAIAPVVVLALLCAGSGQARADDVTNVTIDSLGQQSIYSTWLGFVFLHTTRWHLPGEPGVDRQHLHHRCLRSAPRLPASNGRLSRR